MRLRELYRIWYEANHKPTTTCSDDSMMNTFGATNSLKGIAICAVLINHFLNYNVKGNFLWFASLFVSIFFIVSGYGIYHSLNRTYGVQPLRFKQLVFFYFNRLLRIYPLFLVAYIAQNVLFDTPIQTWSILGIHVRGHFWFIPAILQCYLLAPLLFICIRKYRFVFLNALLIFFLAGNVALTHGFLPDSLSFLLRFIHQHWRSIYFLSILLFGLGMILPQYLESWETIPSYEKKYLFTLSFSLVLFMMIIFKYQTPDSYLYSLFTKTICPLLLLYTSAIYLLANGLAFRPLAWIGKASFTIYLFHIILYRSVNNITGLGKNSLLELLIVLIILPLFFFLCAGVERWNQLLYERLRLK